MTDAIVNVKTRPAFGRGAGGHDDGGLRPGDGPWRPEDSGDPGGRVVVAPARESDRERWDAFVSRQFAAGRKSPAASHPATGYHEWAWRGVFERSFDHTCIYLAAQRDERIVGILPLVEIKSLLFGRTVTSLPFLNYGGVVAESSAVARALLNAAAETAHGRRCRSIELRHIHRQFDDLPFKQHKVAMLLRLQPGMWELLDRKVRNQVRKAEKSGLTVESGGAEFLGDFYAVFSRNMRDLGTPVYGRRFFREVLRAFPGRTRLFVVRLNGVPIAASLTFRTGHVMEVPWASSVRDYNALCPNHLLYWNMIETARADGCVIFDFGRSTPGEGTFRFKEQWGASPVPLNWEYCLLRDGGMPDQSPKNPKFRLAIAAWKKCPLWLANAVGPRIVRTIP
jgi:FemAB-related protein (PEP-CTERM system-associated)